MKSEETCEGVQDGEDGLEESTEGKSKTGSPQETSSKLENKAGGGEQPVFTSLAPTSSDRVHRQNRL